MLRKTTESLWDILKAVAILIGEKEEKLAQEMVRTTMLLGTVEAIYTTPSAGEAMEPQTEAEAIPGQGIEGDRYLKGTGYYSKRPLPDGGRQITLIEIEELEELEKSTGIHLDPSESRRNILTRDIRVNDLIGKQFKIGEVVCEGVRICEPCTYLEKLTSKRVMRPLVHKGGLRARVLSGATIKIGDEIRESFEKLGNGQATAAGMDSSESETAGEIDPEEVQAEGILKKNDSLSAGTHYLESEDGEFESALVSEDLQLDDFLDVRVRAFGHLLEGGSDDEQETKLINAFLVSAI